MTRLIERTPASQIFSRQFAVDGVSRLVVHVHHQFRLKLQHGLFLRVFHAADAAHSDVVRVAPPRRPADVDGPLWHSPPLRPPTLNATWRTRRWKRFATAHASPPAFAHYSPRFLLNRRLDRRLPFSTMAALATAEDPRTENLPCVNDEKVTTSALTARQPD